MRTGPSYLTSSSPFLEETKILNSVYQRTFWALILCGFSLKPQLWMVVGNPRLKGESSPNLEYKQGDCLPGITFFSFKRSPDSLTVLTNIPLQDITSLA